MQLPTRVLLTMGVLALGLLAMGGGSTEAGFVFAGDHVLLPNQAGQVINILASPSSPGELAPGFNFNLVIDDGGSQVGGLDNNAPKITAVTLRPAGGLFNPIPGDPSNVPTTQSITQFTQKLYQVTIAVLRNDFNILVLPEITTNVLLARVTLDTTGLNAGNWALRLDGLTVPGFPSLLPSDFAGNATAITNGTLRINAVPEPSTLALLCCTSCVAVFLRKRRVNWLFKSRDV